MIQLQAYTYHFKLTEPLAISFHTFYYRENILIQLHWNDFVGVGEAAPFKSITGDDENDVLRDAKLVKTLDIDPTKDSVETVHAYVNQRGVHSYTLHAAVDFAYHDLVGKVKGIPAYKLYSKKPTPVDNSLTVFVKDTLKETEESVHALYKRDPEISILKIKLKGEHDIERTKTIKKISPSYMRFTVDANQGFADPKKAVEDLNEIGKILGNVILVEEPCPKGELDKLKYVTDHVEGMLVFADESAATIEDARDVIAAKAAHGINIKLQKAGGIWPAKQIAQMCIDNNLKIMVGCMLEGPFALAAGIHFAVSTPNIILTDLDGDSEADMPKHTDTISPTIQGQRIPLEKPGFGIELDEVRIKKLVEEKEMVYKQEV